MNRSAVTRCLGFVGTIAAGGFRVPTGADLPELIYPVQPSGVEKTTDFRVSLRP